MHDLLHQRQPLMHTCRPACMHAIVLVTCRFCQNSHMLSNDICLSNSGGQGLSIRFLLAEFASHVLCLLQVTPLMLWDLPLPQQLLGTPISSRSCFLYVLLALTPCIAQPPARSAAQDAIDCRLKAVLFGHGVFRPIEISRWSFREGLLIISCQY